MQESYKKFHVGDPHGQREGHPQGPHHVWHIYAFSAIQLFFPQKIVYYMLKIHVPRPLCFAITALDSMNHIPMDLNAFF